MNNKNMKAISFRLNLEDESDRFLYEQLSVEAERYSSLTACLKDLVDKYLYSSNEKQQWSQLVQVLQINQQQQLEEIKQVILAEMRTQNMELLGALLRGIKMGRIDDNSVENESVKIQNVSTMILPNKEDFVPKTFTKQEVKTKTKSSVRELPIPDLVFEAILKERKRYEANRNRRKEAFQDLDYICCSTYGRPRSKNYHWKYYKELLSDNGLPDIRWHDLRSTYCTLLLKNNYSPKAVAKLMGHSKEIITMDVYGDNQNICMLIEI